MKTKVILENGKRYVATENGEREQIWDGQIDKALIRLESKTGTKLDFPPIIKQSLIHEHSQTNPL